MEEDRIPKLYHNPWIPSGALEILRSHTGTILDVGGAAPYFRASHIIDIQPYSAGRLSANAWGMTGDGGQVPGWSPNQYTQLDICGRSQWPFQDKSFDLALCSHCLEDLRDPIPAVLEMQRVCGKVLIIAPSRLLEQTRGIDHPRFCGFAHHPWMVSVSGKRLVFRRKTPVLELPGAHLVCPAGKTLGVDDGSMFAFGVEFVPEEQVFWSNRDDFEDYKSFIQPYMERAGLFTDDGKSSTLRSRIWRFKQKYMGAV